MPKTRAQKAETLAKLHEVIGPAKSLVFAKYEGLPVKDIEELRKRAKEQGVAYTVAKKTLLKQAIKDAGISLEGAALDGNFALLAGMTDEVAPAKIVAAFMKDHDAMKIVGGVLNGQVMDAAHVMALSKLPSKQELLGMLVGTLQAPIGGFVNVLAGNIRGLVTALAAIKDQKAPA